MRQAMNAERIPRANFRACCCIAATFLGASVASCDSSDAGAETIYMSSVRFTKDDTCYDLASSAWIALREKGEIWDMYISEDIADRAVDRNGSVGGSLLAFAWICSELNLDLEIDHGARKITIVGCQTDASRVARRRIDPPPRSGRNVTDSDR